MISVGPLFASFGALKEAVEKWAVSENFTIRLPVKDKKCADFASLRVFRSLLVLFHRVCFFAFVACFVRFSFFLIKCQ